MAKVYARCRMVVRQWEILELLGLSPRTLTELASLVGDGPVNDRTIRRDIEALEAARFPLYVAKDDDGAFRWRLLRSVIAPRRAA